MTAQGKTNASKVQTGDRILVRPVDNNLERTDTICNSETKTGEGVTVARVTGKVFRPAQGRYERQGKYVIETTAGTFEASAIRTMWLAPEDPAGIKRAHAEALELDKVYEADRRAAREFARAWDDAHRENEDRDGVVRPIHHLRRGYQTHLSCGVTDFYYADTSARAVDVTCEACKAADDQEYMDRVHADALDEDDERRVQAWHQRMVDRDHAEALNEDAARTIDEDHDRARAEDTHRFHRAVEVAGFRRCVRGIRADRARGFNDPVAYRRFREAMSFYARAVRLHDRRIRAI